jgi:excisionase family DNA binding protein
MQDETYRDESMRELDADRFLTVEEVAERLNLSTETIRRWLRSGRLRGIRIGARRAGWRIREHDLAAYLHDQMTKTEQS